MMIFYDCQNFIPGIFLIQAAIAGSWDDLPRMVEVTPGFLDVIGRIIEQRRI
jgi:hypothetical protein